jgi:hypothetical protein
VKKRRESGKIRRRQLKPSGYDILEASSAGLSGSREGVARLHGIAAIATQFLTALCQRKPELCAEIARQKLEWPVLFAPHHERKADISKLIAPLALVVFSGRPKGRHSRQFAEIDAVGTDKRLRLLLVGESRSGKQGGKIATRLGGRPTKLPCA